MTLSFVALASRQKLEVHTSVLLKHPGRPASARSCACIYLHLDFHRITKTNQNALKGMIELCLLYTIQIQYKRRDI